MADQRIHEFNRELSNKYQWRWAVVHDDKFPEALVVADVQKGFETLFSIRRKMNIYISHHAAGDAQSKHPFKHYHITFVMEKNVRSDNALRFVSQWISDNQLTIKTETIKFPCSAVAYMEQPPRHLIFQNEEFAPGLWNQIVHHEAYCVAQRATEQNIGNRTVNPVGLNPIAMMAKDLSDMMLKHGSCDMRRLYQLEMKNERFLNIQAHRQAVSIEALARIQAVTAIRAKRIAELAMLFEPEQLLGDREFYSIPESVETVEKLLDSWQIPAVEFFLYMFYVMDSHIPKINTLQLVGPANSGKSYLLRSIQRAAILCGEIHRGDNQRSFVFQEAIDTRVILMNEPSFEHTAAYQLLEVLEGLPTRVDVKYKLNQTLHPTPVLISGNFPIWQNCPAHEPAMRKRCILLSTQTASWLQGVRKELHPGWISEVYKSVSMNTKT